MYIATRCLTGKYLKPHIAISYKPDNIDMLNAERKS